MIIHASEALIRANRDILDDLVKTEVNEGKDRNYISRSIFVRLAKLDIPESDSRMLAHYAFARLDYYLN